jgi:hypothetical protein
MEDSDQDVQEIDRPVLNWTKRKNYHRMILIEPLDPYFCRRSKRNTANYRLLMLKMTKVHIDCYRSTRKMRPTSF